MDINFALSDKCKVHRRRFQRTWREQADNSAPVNVQLCAGELEGINVLNHELHENVWEANAEY